MRNLILFGIFIILLLAAQFASAKTVDEVIEKYIRARGGKDRLLSIKAIYLEGITAIAGAEAIIKITKQQDKLSRTETDYGTQTGLVLITDKAVYAFSPHGSPMINRIHDKDLTVLQTETDIAGPLIDYVTKGHKAELLGKDIVDGTASYKIKLTVKTGEEMFFWVDKSTYLINKSSSIITGSGDIDKNIFILYSNYKEVDGIMFAHTCEMKNTGAYEKPAGEVVDFYTIVLNPEIEPIMYTV